jgi:hypothetical protein
MGTGSMTKSTNIAYRWSDVPLLPLPMPQGLLTFTFARLEVLEFTATRRTRATILRPGDGRSIGHR